MNRDIPINELSWLCTHNAFNSADEIGAGAHQTGGTNQNHSIPDQLSAGVRMFMIDVHNYHDAPRVGHGKAAGDPGVGGNYYEDLWDLLKKFKKWLDDNPREIVILMMEVAADVPAEWIYNTFRGQPHKGDPNKQSGANQAYNLGPMLYEHPGLDRGSGASVPWITINQLVNQHKRVIVFRETDEGKGKRLIGGRAIPWYHDMWAHWVETPYGNSNEKDLQLHTYELLRRPDGNGNLCGDPALASFLILNHFTNTGQTGSGSAGFSEGINQDKYLTARALIAWKMNGKRPTLAVDFFKSIAGQTPAYNTLNTANELDSLPSISGNIELNALPFTRDVTWTGVNRLNFSDHYQGPLYRSGSDGPNQPASDSTIRNLKPTSRGGYYCFPSDDAKGNAPMTLTPNCPGYIFTPSTVQWDGRTSKRQNIVVQKV